jgi:transglutaminase-like putative cysteine protease
MQITIRHAINLGLGDGVLRAVQHLLLTPQTSSGQTVREWSIDAPGMDEAIGFIDAYGNRAHLTCQTKPEPEITITASGVVETHDRSGVVGRLETDPVAGLFRRVTPLTKPIGAITSRFRSVSRERHDRIELLHALMARVGEVIAEQAQTQSQSQDGQSQSQGHADGQPAEPADFAHAFIGAARALDIPARYVSGYLVPENGEEAAIHAWAEAWEDGIGWIGFDPVLNVCPTENHVRMACGLDALSAVPVRSVPVAGTPQAVAVHVEAGS